MFLQRGRRTLFRGGELTVVANALPPKNRYLVPNFRSFRHTVSLGEIAGLGVDRATRLVRTDFDERVAAWRRGRALGVAGDVLSAAQVSGGVEPDTVNEAAGFVIEHAHQSPQPLLDAARRALGHRSQVDTTDDGVRRHFASPILDEHERRRTYENIHSAKRAVSRFGNNAVIFTELARLYLTLGNEERATVESTTGAVAVGRGGSCSRRLSPMPVPHSSPWLRFQSPLVEPDMQISRIRLSDEIMPSPTESSPCVAQGA